MSTIVRTGIDGLAAALDLGDHELVALVGGAGKTASMDALGRQLCGTVVLATLAEHRGTAAATGVLYAPCERELVEALRGRGTVRVQDGPPANRGASSADRWLGLADHVVVEADRADPAPFRAPTPLEPRLPTRTTSLLACVGADALGRVIADQCAHPLRVAAIADCSPYERLTPTRLAAVLASDRGSCKNRPRQASFGVIVNEATDHHIGYLEDLAGALADGAPLIAVEPNPAEGLRR